MTSSHPVQDYVQDYVQLDARAKGLLAPLCSALVIGPGSRPSMFRIILNHPAVSADPYREVLIPFYNEKLREWNRLVSGTVPPVVIT